MFTKVARRIAHATRIIKRGIATDDPGIVNVFSRGIGHFFGGGGALRERIGRLFTQPSEAIADDIGSIGPDAALQISTVWACVDLVSRLIAMLPFFVYQQSLDGHKTLARTSRLYQVLHSSPNSRMTAYEFWVAMVLNLELRGNAYARLDRDARTGEVIAMWPMPSDQVDVHLLGDGSMVYLYRIGADVAVFAESSVLHIKGMGNGTLGLSTLEFMRATTDEVVKAQMTASKLFATSGKPTGVLMVDRILDPEQRAAVKKNFSELGEAGTGRLHLMEANMRYQAVSMNPEDQQLLQTRSFLVEEICRWRGVPPVLIHHANVTAWGSGISQIVDGFHKLKIAPLLKNIEQAVAKRVLTARQRVTMVAEFNHDALLRGSAEERFKLYSTAVQNGLKTRNECRQLENDEPLPGGDVLTAQSNLAPLTLLGSVKNSEVANENL